MPLSSFSFSYSVSFSFLVFASLSNYIYIYIYITRGQPVALLTNHAVPSEMLPIEG
jgi:hypothetical protein